MTDSPDAQADAIPSDDVEGQFVDGEEGELLGEVEVEAEAPEAADEPIEQFDFTPSPRASRPRTPVKQEDPNQSLKALAVPLLATVGGLLLIPAFWSILLLCGAHVWAWRRENATTMAVVMLMCWPIAGVLLAAAVIFYQQIQREKAAMAPATPEVLNPPTAPAAASTPTPAPEKA